MSEPFIGEIRMFGFDWPPKGWARCDGAILPISQHQTIYALLGNAFGGDGRSTFGLPEMRGRVPVHEGQGYYRGLRGGVEAVGLSANQMPEHTHAVMGTTDIGDLIAGAETRGLAKSSDPNDPIYGPANALTEMNTGVLQSAPGGGQSHNNMQPINVVNFCIAMEGLFPSRN